MSRIHVTKRPIPPSSNITPSSPVPSSPNPQSCSPYDREALVNFWGDLPPAAKKALLRIDEEAYLTALENFLVRHSLCCECHDNVIAEWEDHKRHRSGHRSLRHVFTVEEGTADGNNKSPKYGKSCKSQVAIREDNTDFILDLIHCGEEFSYVMPYRPLVGGDDESEGDGECPGANTSHLAQEYLLEVLSFKFREQVENAYQVALQHSLDIQAQLLEDELASMQLAETKAASKRKKKKDKKKKRKKSSSSGKLDAISGDHNGDSQSMDEDNASGPGKDDREDNDSSIESDLEGQIDREVEDFRLLLEKINKNGGNGSRKKLVLPPGTFLQQTASVCHPLNMRTLQAA